jgi:hypothetical protein
MQPVVSFGEDTLPFIRTGEALLADPFRETALAVFVCRARRHPGKGRR